MESSCPPHLGPAPVGVDAPAAWNVAGGDGAGQRLIVVERGWTLDHEALLGCRAVPRAPLWGDVLDDARAHGTAVLGVICGGGHGFACAGLAPGLASIHVVSWWGDGNSRAQAILTAVEHLSFGDVLLLEIEAQPTRLPTETGPEEFEAIRAATSRGVVVVEPAGNRRLDLDDYRDAESRATLNRSSTDFRDSGAVLVGAATADMPHRPCAWGRFHGSNYGNRVDCYAWGEGIRTCWSDAAASTDLYTTEFGATSGAAAVITGVALCTQGLAEAQLGRRFSPAELRSMLSDAENGTPVLDGSGTPVGVMPDLARIVRRIRSLRRGR